MKTFKQYIAEEPKKSEEKPTEFFAHFKHTDPKHNPEESEEPVEFFAHFKHNHPKHNAESEEPLKENFAKEELSDLKKDKSNSTSIKGAVKVRGGWKANEEACAHHYDIDTHDDQMNSVEKYTVDSSRLNGALLKNTKSTPPKQHATQIKHLDEVTRHPSNKLKSNMHAYSTVSNKFGKILSKVKPGKTVTSKAYISATTEPSVTQDFRSSHKENHTIQFHLPKGYSKGRHIASMSNIPDEREFLLARGQKFKKIGHETFKDIWGTETHTVHHLKPIE